MSRSQQIRPWVCKRCINQLFGQRWIGTLSAQRPVNHSRASSRPLNSLSSTSPSLQKGIQLRKSSSLGRKPGKSTSSTPLVKNQDYLKIALSSLSHHWDTFPPRPAQLRHAANYFQEHPVKFLWSAPKFHSMDFGSSPEVAFLGRSNVGKSSLLNALIGTPLAHTSSKRGRTRAMNAFSIGADDSSGEDGRKLIVLDMPGYGKGGREEWGKEIMKYLEKRKQLRMAFMLVDCEHGLKPTDAQMLSLFREKDIPHQIILAKVDKILFPTAKIPSEEVLTTRLRELESIMVEMRQVLDGNGEIEGSMLGEFIACTTEKRFGGMRAGIDAVQFAILRAAGMESNEPEPVKKVAEERIVPYDELVWKDE